MPILVNKNCDFHGWHSRLRLKLDAQGLWKDFCAKTDRVSDAMTEKEKYVVYVNRWKGSAMGD